MTSLALYAADLLQSQGLLPLQCPDAGNVCQHLLQCELVPFRLKLFHRPRWQAGLIAVLIAVPDRHKLGSLHALEP